MSSEALELLQLEIQDHRETLAPQLEGFDDFLGVDVQPDSGSQVQGDLRDAQRRETLSNQAMQALDALAADGYPDLPIIRVKDTIYADLADQKRTIDAAFSRYAPLPPEAEGGRVSIEDS